MLGRYLFSVVTGAVGSVLIMAFMPILAILFLIGGLCGQIKLTIKED